MCLAFHIRVEHFFGVLKKKKYLHKISIYFHIFFSQVYLIWAPNWYTAVQTDLLLSMPP